MSTTATDIPALRALLAEATPLPWSVEEKCIQCFDRDMNPQQGYNVPESSPLGDMECAAMTKANAEFIAAAVNALPSLLDRLEAAEREAGDPRGYKLTFHYCGPERVVRSYSSMLCSSHRQLDSSGDFNAFEEVKRLGATLSAIEAYCRQHVHPGSSPGKQEACSAVLGIMGVK